MLSVARAEHASGAIGQRVLGLVAQIREDWEIHQRDWTQPGFRALAIHRFGHWIQSEAGHGLVRGPVRRVLQRLHLMMFRYARNRYGIELHPATAIGQRVRFVHQSGIVISPKAVIGDDCLIRQNVTIGGPSEERWHEAPILGRRVHVGSGAVLIGAITIGDGARIGPNAVVMTDVPAFASVFVVSPRVMAIRHGEPATTMPRFSRSGSE